MSVIILGSSTFEASFKGFDITTMPAILIVDDNPIQAVTRRLILERAHLQVVLASDGPTALSKLDENAHIGMVITDHCMPEMSGPELVKHLRERSKTLPVLVLSGLPEAETEYDGLDVIFRLKPIHPEELMTLSKSLLFPPYDQTA